MQARPEHQETPAGKTLVVVGIVALAVNLRPAAVSVGPVLQEIIRDISEGTAALSGFTQSVGYLLAILGPLGVGVLYDLTGGWVLPLSALIGLSFLQLLAGLAVARPAYIEDQLRPGPALGPI